MAEIALIVMFFVMAVTSMVGAVRAYKDIKDSFDG